MPLLMAGRFFLAVVAGGGGGRLPIWNGVGGCKTYLFNENSASTFVVPLLRIKLMHTHEFEVAVRACGNEDDDDAGDGARMQRDDAVAHHDGCEW